MKKMLAVTLALVLCLGLTVTAFAAPITENAGTESANVKGTFQKAEAPADVYSVNITWGSLEFVYEEGALGTWNPDLLQYENGTEDKWTCAEGANKITVENRSNVGVNAAFAYQAAEAFAAVSGSFRGVGEAMVEDAVALESAVGHREAPQKSVELNLAGELTENTPAGTVIGSVTVTITKAN